MKIYFSTFITGFSDVITKELGRRLLETEVLFVTDGLIIYKTTSPAEDVKQLGFLNNSFVMLKKFDVISGDPIPMMLESLYGDQNLINMIRNSFSPIPLKFRIRVSVKNQFVKADNDLIHKLEEKIAHSVNNLTVDHSLPDIELLVIIRSEGFGVAGVQFTRRSNHEKTLEKGELYPELAYIMCLLSDPDPGDIFFDPFAGSGSIPYQRLKFPYTQIIAGEIDREKQKKLKTRLGDNVRVEPVNGLSLSIFSDESISKIVTDPPWGLHDDNIDIPQFYSQMLVAFHRVLSHNGVAVILTAQKELLEKLLNGNKNKFTIERVYSTLVSGKKAGVYKIKKIG